MSVERYMLRLNAASHGVPGTILLIPAGIFCGTGRLGSFSLDDPQVLIDRSLPAGSGCLPVDYNHAPHLAVHSEGDVLAAGWITCLHSRQDGIWGDVEWTDKGRSSITSHSYCLIAPVFMTDRHKNIRRFVSAALIDIPNLMSLVLLGNADGNAVTAFDIPAGSWGRNLCPFLTS